MADFLSDGLFSADGFLVFLPGVFLSRCKIHRFGCVRGIFLFLFFEGFGWSLLSRLFFDVLLKREDVSTFFLRRFFFHFPGVFLLFGGPFFFRRQNNLAACLFLHAPFLFSPREERAGTF